MSRTCLCNWCYSNRLLMCQFSIVCITFLAFPSCSLRFTREPWCKQMALCWKLETFHLSSLFFNCLGPCNLPLICSGTVSVFAASTKNKFGLDACTCCYGTKGWNFTQLKLIFENSCTEFRQLWLNECISLTIHVIIMSVQ